MWYHFAFLTISLAILFSLGAGARSWRILPTMVLLILLATWVSNLTSGWLQVRRRSGYESEHPILYEKWNALSRVTVYEDAGWLQPFGWGLSPTYTTPDPGHLFLLIDAKAGTPIQKWTTGDWAAIDFLRYDLTSIAYYILPEANTLAIGSGGGRDILTGLLFGARQITGVELNPAIVQAARDEFGESAGRVYDQPNVRVEIEDARTYLAGRDEQFDLIQASLIDTWAASAAGAFALSENSLYTRQAFLTYYDRLTPRGIVSFSRWYLPEEPAETLRLIAVLVLQLLLLPTMLRWTQQAVFAGRLATCAAAVAPVGFLMGQPFPLGIKWLGGRGPSAIPWLWAVNGAASVAGSTLATVTALRTGFTVVGAIGIGCCGLALVLTTYNARRASGT
jgi:SAM-dependent methyltransferase